MIFINRKAMDKIVQCADTRLVSTSDRPCLTSCDSLPGNYLIRSGIC